MLRKIIAALILILSAGYIFQSAWEDEQAANRTHLELRYD